MLPCAFLLFLVSGLAFAAEAPLPARPASHAGWEAAAEAAGIDHSLVLLVFSAEWCGPCKLLKKETLDSKEFLEGGGALHLADVDIDANEKLAQSFNVEVVPTLILLSAEGKIVSRRTGFLEIKELLAWIEEGRQRARNGQWEGTAPGRKTTEFVKKSAADGLDSADLTKLAMLLGDTDPAERSAAAKLLRAEREKAFPVLLETATDAYLGVRIGSADVLQQLAPEAPALDPWQSPDELKQNVAMVKQWFAKVGKLPELQALKPDPQRDGSIKSAVETLRKGDALQRTEAMSTLVGHGANALPAIREACKRAESAGDARLVGLLEDVRWAILIPDSLEKEAGGVRRTLARGASQERQIAATRLGAVGHEALEPLSELINDSDPLVIENAVRALSAIGGKEAVPAMAVLLKAADSNLRMTAAQALGRTKTEEASKAVLAVIDDPNEVVACTALTALDEIYGSGNPISFGNSSAKPSRPPEVVKALRGALSDPRWRVRATGAEVIGKLNLSGLASDVKPLLEDEDGFVVKTALSTLSGIGGQPDADKLLAISKRLPGIRSDVVKQLVQIGTVEAVAAVTTIYDSAGPADKPAIIHALSGDERHGQPVKVVPWKSLLSRAATSSDNRSRRATAALLAQTDATDAGELLTNLLSDEDQETRAFAAEALLTVLTGGKASPEMVFSSGIDIPEEGEARDVASVRNGQPKKTAPKPEQLQEWHKALALRKDPAPRLPVAVALLATARDGSGLSEVERALDKMDPKTLKGLSSSAVMAALIPRLKLPEANPVLERMTRTPLLYAMAASKGEKITPAIADYLLDPVRVRGVVEKTSPDELSAVITALFGTDDYGQTGRGTWSLLTGTERSRTIGRALFESTNPVWRAVACFALGRKADAKTAAPILEKGLHDPNSWVRSAAIQGLGKSLTDRAQLEQRLGPLLEETNRHVAAIASVALLDPDLRQASTLGNYLDFFVYEKIQIYGRTSYISSGEERPLNVIEARPPFLEAARRWMLKADEEHLAPFSLLLAQYGDFSGLERMITIHPGKKSRAEHESSQAVLAGITLSQDKKFLPYVRELMAAMSNEYELRNLLKAVKGMSGPEARQLRLDINKQMRKSSG
jgi:thioredoxin 1